MLDKADCCAKHYRAAVLPNNVTCSARHCKQTVGRMASIVVICLFTGAMHKCIALVCGIKWPRSPFLLLSTMSVLHSSVWIFTFLPPSLQSTGVLHSWFESSATCNCPPSHVTPIYKCVALLGWIFGNPICFEYSLLNRAQVTFQCWGLTIVFTSQTCVLIIPYILFTCLCFYNYLAYLWHAWVIAHSY
jgi:hypothetical protein